MFDRRRAETRYKIAKYLVFYGLIALTTFIPLIILSLGNNSAEYIAAYVFSGLLALMAATALGIYNLYYLKRNPPQPLQARIFE